MFNSEIDIYLNTIELAKKRRKEYELRNPEEEVIDLLDNLEDILYESQEEKDLSSYLAAQDFEVVKNLQSIMYLGREVDYDRKDSPTEILKKQRHFFDTQGWNEKEIEISQMTDKVQLDKYLENGLKILNIL